MEGPNHFADMDQPNPDGDTLLDLTESDDFIDPDKWDAFYDTVRDILSGDEIFQEHRGLLPFRVWQIFDAMVEFVSKGEVDEFVCAAGVLTHYLGDACQPLHISYLHDGDPERPVKYTHTSGKHAGESEMRPLGKGVHSAYEDDMIFARRDKNSCRSRHDAASGGLRTHFERLRSGAAYNRDDAPDFQAYPTCQDRPELC